MEEKLIRKSQHADSEEGKNKPIQIHNIMTNRVVFTQAFIMTFLA